MKRNFFLGILLLFLFLVRLPVLVNLLMRVDWFSEIVKIKNELKNIEIRRRTKIIIEKYIKFTSNKELMEGVLRDLEK